MSQSSSPSVAVLGARGIGRHHARWWYLSGATLVAHLGTSEESLAAARAKVNDLIPYDGQGYTSLTKLLAEQQPEWVDVSTSNACHYAQVKEALLAGANVLCEKPLAHDPALSSAELIAQADELVALAAAQGRALGMCLQYWISMRTCLRLFRKARGDETIERFEFHLASPAKGRPADPVEVWVDLGPHAVSALQSLAAAEGIAMPAEPAGLERNFDGYRAECRARVGSIDCVLHADRTTADPQHVREIVLNDLTFTLGGRNDADGIYRAHTTFAGGEETGLDAMHALIGETVAGRSPVQGERIVTNQRWLLACLG